MDAHKSWYTKYETYCRLETGGKDKRVYLMDGLLPLYFSNCVNFGFRIAQIVRRFNLVVIRLIDRL